MIELLILICAVIAAVYTPIEAKKVHNGWVRPKFKGTPEEFRAKYVKQLKVFTWVGFVLGALYIALGAAISDSTEQLIIKVIIGGVWIVVGAINLAMRRKYFEPAAGPVSRQ